MFSSLMVLNGTVTCQKAFSNVLRSRASSHYMGLGTALQTDYSLNCWRVTLVQESPRQTKPKEGPKRKVHEFRPFL